MGLDQVLIGIQQGVLTVDPALATVKPLITRRYLERFKGPNDLIVNSRGNIYFTDRGQTGITDQTGKVYRMLPDRKLESLVENGVSLMGLCCPLMKGSFSSP